VVSRASQLLDFFASKQRRASNFALREGLGRRATVQGLPERRSKSRSSMDGASMVGIETDAKKQNSTKPSECALCGNVCPADSCFCPPCTQRFDMLGPSPPVRADQFRATEKHWAQQSPEFNKLATASDVNCGSESTSRDVHTTGCNKRLWGGGPSASMQPEVSNCVLHGSCFESLMMEQLAKSGREHSELQQYLPSGRATDSVNGHKVM